MGRKRKDNEPQRRIYASENITIFERAEPGALLSEKCAYCKEAKAWKTFWLRDRNRKLYFCRYNHQMAYERERMGKEKPKEEKKITTKVSLLDEENGRQQAITFLQEQKAGTRLTAYGFWKGLTGEGRALSVKESEKIREFLRMQVDWLPTVYMDKKSRCEGFIKRGIEEKQGA